MHGSGFGPGETITVKLAGDEVASSTSDNTGAFDTTFVISSAYAGRGRTELTVSAQGETGPPQSSVRGLGRVVVWPTWTAATWDHRRSYLPKRSWAMSAKLVGMRDANSFDEFYRTTSVRLMGYGYAVTGDLAEAQDLVQEAYTRAWQRWRTVSVHPNPEGWVRLVVTRLATDRWRRLGRRRAALLRSGPTEYAPPPGEDAVMLTAALRGLPVAHRQALALHYLMDLPVAEIAAEAGVAVNTVKSWLSRGRAGLVAALAGTPPIASHREER